ncbi:MAG: FAD-dependent oxidoreductase [Candidatus Omnitrophica bacterium]|nr:FAD-dependent oxidoreductase [Candidatus Omnitrophota bacterium]
MQLETDVLVCGAGCAGLSAALASARNGANTLLVERAGFSGGIITCVGLPFFDGIARKSDKKVLVRGIPLELLWRMGVCEMGADTIYKHNPTIKNIEQFKLLADELIETEPRLEVLYHSFAVETNMEGDRIGEVLVATKEGLVPIKAKTVIDCTGDADIAQRTGTPIQKSEELLPMTMHFRIGNVERGGDLRTPCQNALLKAQEAGDLGLFYGPGLSFMFADDEVYIHAIRVLGDASQVRSLTLAEIQGRKDAWTMYDYWKREVPAFKNAYYISSGPYMGIRETCRIEGVTNLTEEDVRGERLRDDAVATGCWYMDIHPQKTTLGSANEGEGFQPDFYDIPYGSLLPKKVSNLLVAGRCHGADRMAASSSRVSVTCMAMGQAAGTAAALATDEGKGVQELEGTQVRAILEAQHAGPYREG